eukprot:353795-Chlamydomonas_euryale.AAC.2
MDVYMHLRELVGSLWYRPRRPLACHLNVEEFDWAGGGAHGATVSRLRAVLGGATTLSLPRGARTLRVTANADLLHAITFQSRTEVLANEYDTVRAVGVWGCGGAARKPVCGGGG